MNEKSASYQKHVIIDLEFTPVPKKFAEQRQVVKFETIQIGAVLLDRNYRKISTFSTYIKPALACHIKPSVSKLTGITDMDLVNAPSFAEAMEKLVAWIGEGEKIRIYSWSKTDLHQMQGECRIKNVEFPTCMSRRWMDFQSVYGRLISTRQKLSLKNAVVSANGQFLGTQAHTALYDAMATAELLILTRDKEDFLQRTRTVRELLAPPKAFGSTIGEMYGTQLAKFLT